MDVALLPTGPTILRSRPASGPESCGTRRECVSLWETLTSIQQSGRIGSRLAMANDDGDVPAPGDVALQVSRMQPARRAEGEVLVALARRAGWYRCWRMTIVFDIEREGIP